MYKVYVLTPYPTPPLKGGAHTPAPLSRGDVLSPLAGVDATLCEIYYGRGRVRVFH